MNFTLVSLNKIGNDIILMRMEKWCRRTKIFSFYNEKK